MKFLLLFFITLNLCAVDFNNDIRPILSRNCFSCHGPEKQKGKLRLDKREFALKVLRKEKNKILLLERIFHNDPDELMPPPEKHTLSDNEKIKLKSWVLNGAEYQRHWAFESPLKSPPPLIKDQWIQNDIDKFILHKLKVAGLNPNPVEFDYRLFRRLALTLTGLPPTEAVTQKFYEGKIDYQKYLQELIDSPAFGEHMASWWLDGARYADTNGIEYDFSRPIWPYRDWVINAFNTNMPYDHFLTQQVAGDLIENSGLSQQIATGFLRCSPTTNEMGSIEEEMQIQYAKDRLNTTMAVFSGLTVGCAECHNHKYDPLSQKEYYQLLSYFNNIEGKAVGHIFDRADEPLVPADLELFNKLNEMKSQLKVLSKQMVSVKNKTIKEYQNWLTEIKAKSQKEISVIADLDAFFPFNGKENFATENIIDGKKSSIKGVLFRREGIQEGAIEFRQSCFIDCIGIPQYSETDSFSAGCWVKFTGKSSGLIMGKYYNHKGWALLTDDKQVVFTLSHSKNNAITVKSPELSEGWNHITFVYDGTSKAENIQCYVNGELKKHKIVQNNLSKSAAYNVILRMGSLLNWCRLDNVFCSKKALTSEEIQTIMNFNPVTRFIHLEKESLSQEIKERLRHYYLENINKDYKKLYEKEQTLKIKADVLLKNNPVSMVMKEKKTPNPTYFLKRGNYLMKGEAVKPKLPESVFISSKSFPANRLGLAQWMTDKKNPLTARVFVNKVWLNIFGRGLVETAGDFGLQGSSPTHPELLDWLSVYLVENNWNVKKLIKMILSSSTFQQSSIAGRDKRLKDPDTSRYSYYPRRRLKAEAIRDQGLAISNLLVRKTGGTPVFPYQPMNLWYESTAFTSNTRRYVQSSGKANYRRSIYTFWKRNFPPPFMTIFDAPTRHYTTMQRGISNSPSQALSLLNDYQFTEIYEKTAASIPQKMRPEEKIKLLYMKVLKRNVTKRELTILLNALNNNEISWPTVVSAVMNLDEFISIE